MASIVTAVVLSVIMSIPMDMMGQERVVKPLATAESQTRELAWILAGEASGCPVEALVAIAQVWRNRRAAGIAGGWFGRREPGPVEWSVAASFQDWPDLAGGALYAIGIGDRAKMPWLSERTGRWDCPAGNFVEVWR